MIIKGGEPPIIEQPEPQLGGLIKALNQLVFQSLDKTSDFNASSVQRLQHVQTKLAQMLVDVPLEIQQHLNARGAVHGETKATVGLGKKDNYRMGTIAEHRALANVQAFVNPAGLDNAIEANNNFNIDGYQRNDLFPMAALHNSDLFETTTVTKATIPYFKSGHCPIILQGDRVVLSPVQDDTLYPARSLFLSDAIQAATAMALSESPYVKYRYQNYSWNGRSALTTTDNKVTLFRPLANLKKYDYKQAFTIPGRATYLLWDNYITDLVQGMAVGIDEIGTGAVRYYQDVFKAINATTDPTLSSILPGTYRGVFTTMDFTREQAFNAARDVTLANYITLPAGVTCVINTASPFKSLCTLVWNVPDHEAYLHTAIPVIFTSGTKKVEKILRFTDSIIFGDVTTGNEKASITTIGTLVKDTVDVNLNFTTSQWFTDCDWTDVLNPVALPGVILPSGFVMNAVTTRNGIKVKYSSTTLKSATDWLKRYKSIPKPTQSITRHFSPSRYMSFGEVPERIIPLNNINGITQFLSYQIVSKTHAYGWEEHSWYRDDIMNTTPTNGRSLAPISPESSVVRSFKGDINPSLSVTVGANGGVTINAKAFSNANNFTATTEFNYISGVITTGQPLVLAALTLSALRGLGTGVLNRAEVAYGPGYEKRHSELQIQVFCIDDAKLLAVVSDGLGYAEAGVFNYLINNGMLTASVPSSGNVLTRISQTGVKPGLGARGSLTDNGVNLKFADALFYKVDANTLRVGLNRPFGNVFGDLSFTISNYTTTPILSPGTTNPARLYSNNSPIDLVEELYPTLAIPRYGLFQYAPDSGVTETKLVEVGGSRTMDPHLPPTADFCLAPAGTRVILGGRSFVLDKSYYLGYDGGDAYFYLTRIGNVVTLEKFSTPQEPANNSVLFAKKVGGKYEISSSYIVLNNHVLSYQRKGSAIPVTVDTGDSIGSNIFFRNRDVIG